MRTISIALIILILLYIITTNLNMVTAQESYSEHLQIYQIYDKTIVTGIFSGKYINTLLPNTLTQGLKYFSISVARFTSDTANAYWFINNNPEKESLKYLYWRGIYMNITYDNPSYNPNNLVNWISDKFHIVFQNLNSTSTSYIFYSGGNLDTFYELLLNSTVDWNALGFLTLFKQHITNYLEYRFINKTSKIIMTTVFNTPYSMIPQKPNIISMFNYTKIFNSTLTTSPYSISSLITFNLYGMSINRSDISYTTNIKWISGPNNHWVTTGTFTFPSGITIQKMNIYATLFNQPLIFSIIPDKSHLSDNDTLRITVNVTNPNSINISNVTVNLIIPNAFKETPNVTIYIGNINSNSTVSQSALLHYTHSEQNFLQIRTMYSYEEGSTIIQGYANDILISTSSLHFPSIVYYIKPLTDTSRIDGSNTITYEIKIINVGDDNATNVRLHIGASYVNIGQLEKGKTFSYKINYDPKNITFISTIPKEAEASPPIYVTFTYENTTHTLLSNTTLPSFAKTFSSYAILIGEYMSQSLIFTSQYTVKWRITNIGGSKTVSLILDRLKLSTMGLTHKQYDDFNETSKYLITTKTISFNQSIILSLSLYATRNDTFILPPLFENVTGLPLIVMEPAIFTNAIYVSKNINKISLNINDNLTVMIHVQNLGSKPIFSITINDTLPFGWELVSGSSIINLPKLDANSMYELKYIMKAINPQTQALPLANVTFYVNNIKLYTTSKQITTYVRLLVNINIVAWNDEPLKNTYLIIRDTLNNNATELFIQNGKITWNGYIGTFNMQVIYRNITVYNASVNITGNSSTITLKTAVYPFIIKTIDILNNPINAKISIYYNKTLFEQGDNIVSTLLPIGSYNIIVKSNGKISSIPLDVSGPSIKPVNIRFDTIGINGIQISAPILMLLITLIFIIILIYVLLKMTT